jgi:hypothetical protein
MKRYRVTRDLLGGMGGPQRQFAVVELANDKPAPENSEEVAGTTELHDWQDETLEAREARLNAEGEE